MNNPKRKHILLDFDNWVDQYGVLNSELFMNLQCELYNMQEESDYWQNYATKLKVQNEDLQKQLLIKPTARVL